MSTVAYSSHLFHASYFNLRKPLKRTEGDRKGQKRTHKKNLAAKKCDAPTAETLPPEFHLGIDK